MAPEKTRRWRRAAVMILSCAAAKDLLYSYEDFKKLDKREMQALVTDSMHDE